MRIGARIACPILGVANLNHQIVGLGCVYITVIRPLDPPTEIILPPWATGSRVVLAVISTMVDGPC